MLSTVQCKSSYAGNDRLSVFETTNKNKTFESASLSMYVVTQKSRLPQNIYFPNTFSIHDLPNQAHNCPYQMRKIDICLSPIFQPFVEQRPPAPEQERSPPFALSNHIQTGPPCRMPQTHPLGKAKEAPQAPLAHAVWSAMPQPACPGSPGNPAACQSPKSRMWLSSCCRPFSGIHTRQTP